MKSTTSVIGQAHVTLICRSTTVEMNFIKVQRAAHQPLIGCTPDYAVSQIRCSTVRAGILGQDRQNVVFEPSTSIKLENDGEYSLLIEWDPAESNIKPIILAMCPQKEFDRALAEREQACKPQHKEEERRRWQQQQDALPSFFEVRASEQQIKLKRNKVTDPVKLAQKQAIDELWRKSKALRQANGLSKHSPVQAIDLTTIYSIDIYGDHFSGTVREIVDYFTREWADNPISDLMSKHAVWKKKCGMTYGKPLQEIPDLPHINDTILAQARRAEQEKIKQRKFVAA